MIRHLLRLVWNRKRANALLMLEIFFSFLVVFVVSTAVAFAVSSWAIAAGRSAPAPELGGRSAASAVAQVEG